MRADLDTLVIALDCAACALFSAQRMPRGGRPELIGDNELLALMVAPMLLQCRSDRVFLRRARRRLGHLFPYLRSPSRYNERCRQLAAKLVLLWKALAAETLGGNDDLRLLDTTALRCGQSIETTRRSQLAPWAGFGHCPAHSRRDWGFKLLLLAPPTARSSTSTSSPPTPPSAKRRSHCSRTTRSKAPRYLRQRLRQRRLRSRRARAASSAAAAEQNLRTRPAPPANRLDRQRIESIVNNRKDQLHLPSRELTAYAD